MARRYALVLGIIFVIIGIAGFIGPLAPGGMVLGLFMVNTPHNILHILAGLIGIWAAKSDLPEAPISYAWFVFLLYGLVSILGFIIMPNGGLLFKFLLINRADNWLHLILAISALVVLTAEQRRPVLKV